MDKFVIVGALILIGLFIVLVINNNAAKPQPAILTPTPISSLTQTLNITPSPTSSTSTTVSNTVTAVIKTDRGDITIALYPKEAPNTVNNFVNKAKSGFYDNLIFHRVEDWVIQGGDPDGNGTGGGSIPVEFNNQPFVIGAVGIASRGDGKVQNDAQFFITKKDSQFLNGQYTNFGVVTKGMEVVNKVEIGDKILGITIE